MGYNADSFKALSVDLSALSKASVEAFTASLGDAAKAGVYKYDAVTKALTTTRPPMRAVVKVNRGKGGTITLWVSEKHPKEAYITIIPPLSTDTTGSKRQPIRAIGWRGKAVEIPRGFIWKGVLYRRVVHEAGSAIRRWSYDDYTGSHVTKARKWLVDNGALPSPAQILAKCADEVADAVVEAVHA